jgi:hypothetical protein
MDRGKNLTLLSGLSIKSLQWIERWQGGTVMKMILASLLIVWVLAPLGGFTQGIDSIRPLLEEKWKDLARTVPRFQPPQNEMWNYRITVPFPAFWPPTQGNALVYYAIPYGINLGRLADAELVGAPWARITVQKDNPPQMEILEKKVVKIGIQGVRPITQKEKEIYDSEKAVIGYLGKLSSPPDDSTPEVKALRDFYRLWKSHNGVLADRLVEYHRAFFSWLIKNE